MSTQHQMNPIHTWGYLYGEQLFMCLYQEDGFGCVEQQVGDVTFLDDAGE